jgi:peptidoglycan/LPS O-acetylase OafA/YrhL
MRIELFGSLGIYTFYRFVPSNCRVAALVAIAVMLLASGLEGYLAFPAGALIFELKARNDLRISWIAALALAAAAIALSILAVTPGARYAAVAAEHVIYIRVDELPLLNSIGATMVVLALSSPSPAQDIFMTRLPRFLGRISYSLYLIHMPLLYTLFAWFYLALDIFGHPVATAVWCGAFIAVALLAARAMTIAIDEPTVNFFRMIGPKKRSHFS